MHDFERIDLTLKEIGPAADGIEGIIRNGQSDWDLYLSIDVEINIQFDGDQQELILTSAIGQPNPENFLPIYEALLQYNSIRNQTGGVTMSLGEEGQVQQSFELSLAAADVPTLRAAIENFAEKVLIWRAVTFGDAGETQTDDADSAAFNPGLKV
jgi:hypothetical protein